MAQRKLRDIMSGPGRRTEKQKMLAGELYGRATQSFRPTPLPQRLGWCATTFACHTASEQRALLVERLGHVGDRRVIRPPFFCDYGYNIVSPTVPM